MAYSSAMAVKLLEDALKARAELMDIIGDARSTLNVASKFRIESANQENSINLLRPEDLSTYDLMIMDCNEILSAFNNTIDVLSRIVERG